MPTQWKKKSQQWMQRRLPARGPALPAHLVGRCLHLEAHGQVRAEHAALDRLHLAADVGLTVQQVALHILGMCSFWVRVSWLTSRLAANGGLAVQQVALCVWGCAWVDERALLCKELQSIRNAHRGGRLPLARSWPSGCTSGGGDDQLPHTHKGRLCTRQDGSPMTSIVHSAQGHSTPACLSPGPPVPTL